MLEATRKLLAVPLPPPAEERSDGVAPILISPGQPIRVAGRPRRGLVERVQSCSTTPPDARYHPVDTLPAHELVVVSRRAWRRAADGAEPGTVLLVDVGRRVPRAGPGELVIELRDDRMIEAKGATRASLRSPDPHEPRRSRGRRSLARVRSLARKWLGSARTTRWAVLHVVGGDATRLPEHVRDVVRDSGCDLTGYRMSVHDRRHHRTQKVIIRLASPNGRPDLVVKLVRDPVDGHRIENEANVLRQVAQIPGVATHVPTVVATGHLSGRPLLVQTSVDGEPLIDLLNRSDVRATGALHETVDWAVDLGRRTCHRLRDGQLAALRDIVDRYLAAAVPGTATTRLQEDVATLMDSESSLPLVLMHGDLGTWNIVVARDGGVKILDWEAAEPHGLPLWDIFYLFRNAAVAPQEPLPGPLVHRDLLEGHKWGGLFRRAVFAALEATNTPPELVPALFRLCWVHRAVKEAKRLDEWNFDRGYASLAAHMARLPDERLQVLLLADGHSR